MGEIGNIRMELWDIDEQNAGREQLIVNKAENSGFVDEDDLVHTNEGYVVRAHFAKSDYSATEALSNYLRQIAQLRY